MFQRAGFSRFPHPFDVFEIDENFKKTIPTVLKSRSQGPDLTEVKMKMSKVGNQTNSQDPQAVNSRVFVGNLNTYQCSKTDVERMFQRYGRLAGISMHKGYAFVQFTNPFDARGACLGEDGRTVLGQTLDVNMVAEPKPHQTGRKRQNVAKTGNDWDYYYDSYYASGAAFTGAQRIMPPLKRPRTLLNSPPAPIRGAPNNKIHKLSSSPPPQVKIYSNPDILICGNCREMFSELQELLEHKKDFCKLRFTCKCSSINGNVKDTDDGVALTCVQCKERFGSAWDLMVHVQAAHMLNIYELSSKASTTCERLTPPPQNNGQAKDPENGDNKMDHSDEENHAEPSEKCIVGAISIEASSVSGPSSLEHSLTNGTNPIAAAD
ncbi:RNA Hypothetical protein protein [Nesidiocoris tenuis]|uniref:RRM domain-containing protein n=1 Tax=Nesidiocoris tenuis TaxID=355587 RepID=A0ABN7B4U6_9HEMI|nr:RNA Hypothetical protein protein [Nesidiocoris tenuis]